MQAVDKLNAGKSDGNDGLMSDHFKAAGYDLCVYILFLLSGLLTHDVVPDDLARRTVVSMPKGKNVNLTDSSNYRRIALSSVFGKFFDLVVLSRYGDRLCSSDLQCDFKAKRSTNMCTMVLKEAIAYYVNNGSSVFCTLLDATKAFDRVEYEEKCSNCY